MNFRLLFTFLLVLSASSAQETVETAPYTYYDGQVVYLLADSVNIRKEASLTSDIAAQLPIGTKLTVISASENVTTLNNVSFPWYLVEFNGKKRGYVWGGKIAANSFRSSRNTDYVFHFGLEKADVDGIAYFQIRVEKNHQEVQRVSFKGMGGSYKQHICTNHSNRGLTNVDDVIYIDAYSESCGDGGGAIVLFWSGEKLTFINQLWDMMDAPYFTSNYYVFPSDMEGQKDKIVFHEEDGEYIFEEENPKEERIDYSKNIVTFYKWDGKQLVKTK